MAALHTLTTNLCCDCVVFGVAEGFKDVLAVGMYQLNESTQIRHGQVRGNS